jgi:hypothetical protein
MIREDSRDFSTAFQGPPSSRRGTASRFRVVQAALALASIGALAALPSSCQTGGIGDPCTPEDEYRGTFAGFQLTQENIESRSFQCESRICLVNFFQGRVTCPAGQPSKTTTDPATPFDKVCSDDGDCTGEEKCVESAVFAPDCLDNSECEKVQDGLECDPEGFCRCSETSCPGGYVCDENTRQCRLLVCHAPGNCQDPTKTAAENDGKDCCLPGTDTPVASEVCGQCGAEGLRNAENSVYCSCRCGSAEGAPEDENFNFCECPDGFVCAEVRPFLGLGDAQLTGKFCVKADDPIIKDGKVDSGAAANQCGEVVGHIGNECSGQAAL